MYNKKPRIVRRLLHPDLLHALLGLLQDCNAVLKLQHNYKYEILD
jgi:hypothetical protein